MYRTDQYRLKENEEYEYRSFIQKQIPKTKMQELIIKLAKNYKKLLNVKKWCVIIKNANLLIIDKGKEKKLLL